MPNPACYNERARSGRYAQLDNVDIYLTHIITGILNGLTSEEVEAALKTIEADDSWADNERTAFDIIHVIIADMCLFK